MDYGIGGMKMQVSLDRLPIGIPATVVQMSCPEVLLRRLRDFGMIPGTAVMVRYRSPGGGVTALECRGALLAMRTRDLKGVGVQWE
jgi:Fe2+ transport system protein FeoA